MFIIIKNNIIAILFHTLVSSLFLLPATFIWWGAVWDGRLNYKNVVLNVSLIFICTIVAVLIYFMVGKFLIQDVQNKYMNLMSVLSVFLLLLLLVLFFYDGIVEKVLRTPFYPLGGTLSFFLKIKSKYIYVITSLLPSFIMWVGIMSKSNK